MKKLMNVKGAQTLNTMEQKEINGGSPSGCSSSCYGRTGRCYFGGHCGCPGYCINNYCQPS